MQTGIAFLLSILFYSITNAATVTLVPTADAHVRSGTYKNNNYGASTTFELKKSAIYLEPADDYNRMIYMKFDLSSVSNISNITNAKIRLYGSDGNAAENIVAELHNTSISNWTETGITWANKPAYGGVIATFNIQNSSSWHELDLTNWLRAEASTGARIITFVLVNQNPSVASTSFNARETGTNRPQLIVTTSDINPPSVTLQSPASGSGVLGTAVTISATASDDVGVAGVQFKVNGINVGSEDTTSPYSVVWNSTTIKDGNYDVTAVARDTSGNIRTSNRKISVLNIPPPFEGAKKNWITYEAEAGTRNSGPVLVEGTAWGQMPYEASGKLAVTLTNPGESISWSNVLAASHATIRYNIPEGQTGSLTLYVNNIAKATFLLDSTRIYEKRCYQADGTPQCPTGQGGPPGNTIRFFDEKMVVVPGGIPAGATVKLQKNVSGSVKYTVDFLELELAPAPLAKPDSTWVSVSGTDGKAIRDAIVAASTYKKVWLPAGTYTVNDEVSLPVGYQISGAGMWHTIINRNNTLTDNRLFLAQGSNVIKNMKIISNLTTLVGQNVAIRGDTNSNHIEGVWTEYLSLYLGFSASNNVIISNRIRNSYKDCIHFARASKSNWVENNTIRNCGDDNIALVQYNTPGMEKNTVIHNTGEQGYWGRGFTNLGGDGNRIDLNTVVDMAFSGLLVAVENYGNQPTVRSTNWSVSQNKVIRCGNQVNAWYGASVAVLGEINNPVSGRMEGNSILDPIYHASRFTGYVGNSSNQVLFINNKIEIPPAGNPIQLNLQPSANLITTPNNIGVSF